MEGYLINPLVHFVLKYIVLFQRSLKKKNLSLLIWFLEILLEVFSLVHFKMVSLCLKTRSNLRRVDIKKVQFLSTYFNDLYL